jgi:hypothetical protein
MATAQGKGAWMPTGKGRQQPKKKARARRRDTEAITGAFVVPMPSPFRNIVRLRRTNWIGGLTIPVADTGRSWSFALSDIPGYLGLTAVYDEWRIEHVEFNFNWTGSAAFPTLALYTDMDDSATPASLAVVLERNNVKLFTFSSRSTSFTLRFKPRAPIGTASVIPGASQWVDCNTPSTAYNALAGWLINYNTTFTGGAGVINVSETYHLAFAGQR